MKTCSSMEDVKMRVPEYESKLGLVRKLFNDRLKIAVDYAAINNNSTILDAGCGDGELLKYLPNFRSYVGVDNENSTINKIKNVLGMGIISFDTQSITELQYGDSVFNVIFALDTLEHLEYLDFNLAIKELLRVLASNRILVVSGPTENFFQKFCRFLIKGFGSPESGTHFRNIYEIDKALQDIGFKKVEESSIPRGFPAIIKVIKYEKN